MDSAVFALDDSHLDRAADVMQRGFLDDPLFLAIWPDSDERAKSLKVLCQLNLSQARNTWTALGIGEPIAGSLTANRSNDVGRPDDHFERLESQLSPWAWQRFKDVQAITHADAELLRLTPEPHWYIHMLAVDPEAQGKGFGSALLRAVHTKADRDQMPTILITLQPRNVPIYQHFGYEIVAEGTEPSAGLYYWSMKR